MWNSSKGLFHNLFLLEFLHPEFSQCLPVAGISVSFEPAKQAHYPWWGGEGIKKKNPQILQPLKQWPDPGAFLLHFDRNNVSGFQGNAKQQ